MSRTIKFRAWDNELKEMLEVVDLHMRTEGMSAYVLIDGVSVFRSDLKIMQFTGLTDKNGKEIYEGDVVRIVRNAWNPEEDKVGSVEIRPAHVFIAGMTLTEIGGSPLEVIGNLYENPELLSPQAV
jgi:uncharacterized phage protein (TIGR01671 family)